MVEGNSDGKDKSDGLIESTSMIVSSYVRNNLVEATKLPDLIAQVHATLAKLASPAVQVSAGPGKPAVPIRSSIHQDYLICLEDGRKFKSLKRHLRTKYQMTPQQYREKWGLPDDYPMVAPQYAEERSSLARRMGLGQSRRQSSPKES